LTLPCDARRRQARIEWLREVVATTGIRAQSAGTGEREQAKAGPRVLCPFDLQVWDVDRMLNFEITDDPAVVAGTWTAGRTADRVDLVLDVTRGWRPRGLPPLMAAVTRAAPVFRRWPTTYCWTGTVTLGDQPALQSHWQRTGGRRDQSYRRLTT
jgi:hypothetical protein